MYNANDAKLHVFLYRLTLSCSMCMNKKIMEYEKVFISIL